MRTPNVKEVKYIFNRGVANSAIDRDTKCLRDWSDMAPRSVIRLTVDLEGVPSDKENEILQLFNTALSNSPIHKHITGTYHSSIQKSRIYMEHGQCVLGVLSELQVLDEESLYAKIHDVELILPAELESKLRPLMNKNISILRIDDLFSVEEVV